jgi:subtilisin family serine protease
MRSRALVFLVLALAILFRTAVHATDRTLEVVSLDVLSTLANQEEARVIIALKEPAAQDLGTRKRAIQAVQADVLSSLSGSDFELQYQYQAISALAGRLRREGLVKLVNHPNVLQISLDRVASGQLAESVPLIQADLVQELGFTGEAVVVAVLDTGIDTGHPDLKDALIAEQCFCSVETGCCPNGLTEQSGPGSARDGGGHGTNVAGIIASRGNVASVGVAPGTSIVAVKVLDDTAPSGRGDLSVILRGLDWIINERPDVQIVNMSIVAGLFFGDYCDAFDALSRAYAQAIDLLRAQGVLTFVSSGNLASATGLSFPSCLRSAVAVGAVYDDDVGTFQAGDLCTDQTTAADQIVCFTNRNRFLSLLAPGCKIRAPGLRGGTSTFCGTSQAAPHAAGVAALMLSANADL